MLTPSQQLAQDGVAGQLATPNYAVFGNPIKHSKSPVIHSAFARQFDEEITYRALSIDIDQFEARVTSFFVGGGCGLNVTVPFKERAYAMADEASDRARRAGAANCLIPIGDGRLRADNTDGIALVRDMVATQGWQLSGRRTLIIGAGGAVRGILQPLMAEGPQSIVIANRTAQKAHDLGDEFSDNAIPVTGCGLQDIAGQTFDLIISGTSAGLRGELPDLPDIILSDRCCCYDLGYGAEPTPFMRWSAGKAAWAVADGLGMLVEQAAESYFLWRGRRPSTSEVIQQLRILMTV